MKNEKEFKKILNKKVSELDMVKSMIAYNHQVGYCGVTINLTLSDETIEELKSIGFKVETVIDYYNGDYTRIKW